MVKVADVVDIRVVLIVVECVEVLLLLLENRNSITLVNHLLVVV